MGSLGKSDIAQRPLRPDNAPAMPADTAKDPTAAAGSKPSIGAGDGELNRG